jgi:uncharacterized membrane protein HdeD (DUF308 family)
MTATESQADFQAKAAEIRHYVAHRKIWFLALGVLLLLAGAAAIAFPYVSTIATKIALGWLFLGIGVINVVHAFGTRGWRAFALNFLIGLLFLGTGAYLAFFPLAGIVTLTILIAAFFIAEGYLEIMMAIRLQPDKGWAWVLLSGVLAVAAGVLIGLELPDSSAWTIGLLTGINLLASGVSFLLLALSSGSAAPQTAAA